MQAFQRDTEQYCLPREFRTLALIYARADFAANGLQPPVTWDETRQIAEQLTDLNTGSFGLIVAPDLSRWLPWLYQAGGQLIDENGRMALDSVAASTAIDFYIGVFRDNFAGQPGESNSSWAGEVLGKGKGSMAVEGNWIVPYFADAFPNFGYGIAPLPSGPGGRGAVAFASCYAVTAASPRADDAFALANFLTSRDAMQQWTATAAFMPTRISLRAAWLEQFPALSPFMSALNDARVWQLPTGFDAFLRTFNRSMLNLYSADIEAADFLDNMQRLGALILER
ncbi:MAG: extracellular solute-binding protein [Caldilineaceae bacterium]